MLRRALVTTLFALCSTVIPATAAVITDPANAFIPSFTGNATGDLDVLSATATFDGTNFLMGATVNGLIGTNPNALYVFGVNRGQATANFAALGLPGIVFDSVITMTGAGVLGGRDLVTATNITLGTPAQISGSSFLITVPLSALPSLGLTPLQYGFNLWPRDASVTGNAQISDFAPNDTTFNATAVPEPSSVALICAGIAMLAGLRKRSR